MDFRVVKWRPSTHSTCTLVGQSVFGQLHFISGVWYLISKATARAGCGSLPARPSSVMLYVRTYDDESAFFTRPRL